MDLAAMINNGDEALHRGSVDKSAAASESSTPSRPNSSHDTPSRTHGTDISHSGSPRDTQPRNSASQEPAPFESGRRGGGIPKWAHVYRGSRNQVRDVKRVQLIESRPELAEFANVAVENNADAEEKVERAPSPGTATETSNGTVAALPQPSPFAIPPVSASEIGPGGNVSLTGLTASLASLIPNDDQTKVLAGWIFEKVGKIADDSLLDHVEIEFKMGLICDEHSGLRHRFPIMSEAVIDPAYLQMKGLRFKTEIDNARFKSLESVLNEITKANVANELNPITQENVLIRDEVYSVVYEPLGDKKSRVRVSTDDKQRVVECISKQRIGDLHVSMPNAAYDLKMSLSIEHPVDFDAIMPLIKDQKSSFERNKNRLKWTSPGCVVDLTSVHGQASSDRMVVTKEAEVETNSKILASVIREYRNSADKASSLDKFLEVVRYTMDSARFLARNI